MHSAAKAAKSCTRHIRSAWCQQRVCHRLSARSSSSSSSSSSTGAKSSSSTGAMGTPPVPDLSQIKGVLFDIDGTLTNSDPLHLLAFQNILVEVGFQGGVPIDEAFFRKHISGRHNPEIAAELFPDWPEEKRVAFYMDKEQRFRDMAGSVLQRMPGLTEFLEWVDSRQLRKAAVTNAPRNNTVMMLAALKLDSHFEAVVLGEECERAKPHPDPYLKGLKLLGLQPHEAIVIEDSPAGVRAARAAGIAVFGITSGQEEHVLWEAGCCMLMPNFNPLVALAEQHCRATASDDGLGQRQQQQQQQEVQQHGKAAAGSQVVQITANSTRQ